MKFLDYYLYLEQASKSIVILPGGFKPPHKGHFEALKYLLKNSNSNKAIVFVGKKERDGINQDQALQIWNIYKRYIPADVEIVAVTGADKAGREATPLSMTYDFIENNKDVYSGFVVGAGEEDMARFKGLEKDKLKYPNTKVISIPPQFNRISGTQSRQEIKQGKINFMPDEVVEKKEVAKILGI
jgi:ATP sulfurylase